ncbi:MAG: tetratricopeptide repeat protein [Gammaproteobacteria bacterium]|nr:tetratricopeptide repeat protein [Gammaproteobacteria bacterium]MBT4075556.1 tetratricopeptide repeat protein [Gammaproteobacteria bacterium]MBT4450906.1 tetratricopeptide repeat protein [Gammaproteobacteria bacterium]MBT4862583.1 tetratricopeptide repeat protein [Gammaproteobacteria bacterium]MBT6551473.1 tetratricopeptide repeat protein [Gammaproteobacteria bacterium]
MMLFSQSPLILPSALSLLLCLSMPAIATEQTPEKKEHQQKVMDLAYGRSMYYLFQDKKLHAITTLEVAKQRQVDQIQPEDMDLLLGGLYFEYGLPEDSEQLLTHLLDDKTATEIKNRTWFNLARVQYEKNNYQQAEALLTRITETLTPQREAQKHYFLTNIYIKNQQFEQAAETVSQINSESLWSAYSEYNLGVSLNTTQQNQQAQQWLLKLISRQAVDDELRSLQDSARLVLGLTSLRQKQLQDSLKYLGGIHTSSPLTNKALLATGWAWSRLLNHQKALDYWFALVDKKQLDGATLEAYLAIAHAYEKLNNNDLAIQYYEQALQIFSTSLNNMDKAIDSINEMELINTLYQDKIIQPTLESSLENKLPQHFTTPYLHNMFASKEFQQAILNYQELLEIHSSLIKWKSSLPAFKLMLTERENSFESKRELLKQITDFKQLEQLQQQRDALAQEVQRIKQSEDFFALANEDETDYLEQLEDIYNLISKLQSHQDMSDEIQKYRLLSGLLRWELNTDFPRRYWRVLRQLQLLDRALEKAKSSATSLQQASAINELKLIDFKQRIKGQASEIERMEIDASELIDQQEQLINILATDVIENRKIHLTQLKLSAHYSLTRLHDEVSKLKGAQ